MTTTLVLGLVFLSMIPALAAGQELEKLPIVDIGEPAEVDIFDVDGDDPQEQPDKPVSHQRYRDIPQTGEYPTARFKGIWGYQDDNETQGYVGGVLSKRPYVGFLQGLWNTTDNSSAGLVIGILRKGFFNGYVTTRTGDITGIVGLYRVDLEEKTLTMRWMTAQKVGWAYCTLLID